MERRLRRGVTSSVARVLQLDASTSEWLRNLRGRCKDDVVGQYVEYDVESIEGVAVSPPTAPLVSTPMHAWIGSDEYVRYACSFCRTPIHANQPYHVHFNRTLTTPFVVTCGKCGEKMR